MMKKKYKYLIIGGGSAGIRLSKLLNEESVLLVESSKLGGTCVNRGCVPKKLYYYSSQFAKYRSHASSFGWNFESGSFDWATLRENKKKEIIRLNNIYDSVLGDNVDVVYGEARFLNNSTFLVGGQEYSGEKVILCCGNKPVSLDIQGKEHLLFSDDIFDMEKLPKKLLIVGAGYIAVEFACIFANLGVEVEMLVRSQLLRGFDGGMVKFLENELKSKGVHIHIGKELKGLVANDSKICHFSDGKNIVVDDVFLAIGRRPNIETLGLEGLALDSRGYVVVDDYFQTNIPNIYALGDIVSGGMELTPIALKHGNFLHEHFTNEVKGRGFNLNSVVATSVFSSPTLSTVGLTEEDAVKKFHGKLKIFESSFVPMFFSMSEHKPKAFVKLIVHRETDEVLGVHLACDGSEEIIQMFAILLNKNVTKSDLSNTIAVHPSLAEEFVSMNNFRLV